MIIKTIASGSTGNCYTVQDGESGTRILIECGIPIKKIMEGVNYGIHGYEGCLCSHEHADHSKSFQQVMKYGIPIYWTRGTAEACGAKPSHYSRHINPRHCFNIGTFTIIPFEVQHDAADPVGFLIKGQTGKLMFATDTFYIKYQFKGLTHIMIEANYDKEKIDSEITCKSLRDRLYNSHMSINTVCDFFEKLDKSCLQEVHLLHLSSDRSDVDKFKREVQKITGVPVYV